MTKRYNPFNYVETWFGIFLFLLSPLCLYFAYLVFYRYSSEIPLMFYIPLLAFILLILFKFIPTGLKYIRIGQNKAFKCDDGYIYGRVKSCESEHNYIVNSLDCIKALEYCYHDDCTHCPFRISCKRTANMWMIESARKLFDNMDPCDEIKSFNEIIDRYRFCKEEYCSLECSYYDNCLDYNLDNLQKDIYMFFHKNGYTSAEQLRTKKKVI